MLQTAQIGFATMLGSAEKAQKFLDDMADFAVKTPFEYPELLEAAKRMLAYGFAAEEVLPTLRAVGDASAALGSGAAGIDRITLALGQIRAKGKLSGEEMRQLTEAGVPAWHILSEAMGKTVPELQDMVSKGLVPGAKAVEMLTNGMTKRFGGMMASMEDTWQGVTSSIKDIWRMTVGEMTSGLFSGINTWLKGVRDWLSGFYDTFKQFGLQTALLKYFGAEFATMANVVIWAAKTVFNALGWVYGILRKNWGMVSVLATAFLTYVTATKAASLATSLFRTVSLLLSGNLSAQSGILGFLNNVIVYYKVQMLGATATTNIFTVALYKLKAALYAVHTALGPVGWALIVLSLLVAGGMALWNKYAQSVQKAWETSMAEKMKAQQEKLKESIKNSAKSMANQEDALKDLNKAANDNVQSFDEVHQLQEDMAGEDFFLDLNGDTNLDELFEFDLEGPKTSLAGFWEWIKEGAGNLWESVKEKWNSFTSWVSSWEIWTTLKDKWGDVKEWAGNLWESVKEKWARFEDWLGEWWENSVKPWFTKEKWLELFDNMKKGIKEKWDEIKDWWENNAFSKWWREDVKPWFTKEKWVNLYDNIKTSIQEKWKEVKDWWENNAFSKWWREDVEPWFTKEKWVNLYDNIKTSIQEKWKEVKDWWENNAFSKWWREDVSPWFTKEKWLGLYQNMKDSIQEKWAEIKDWWENNAFSKWWREDVEPWFTKEKWVNLYDNMKTSLQETWQGIKDWWKNTTLVKWWNEDVKPWFTKEKWVNLYDNMKTSLQETWQGIKDWWKNTTLVKWWNEDVKPWFTKEKWKEVYSTIKDALEETWEEIKNSPKEWGKNLIENFTKGIKEKANSLKDSLKNVGEQIKNFLGFSSPTKEGPGREADKWAPAFMDMYRKGISQGIPGISSSLTEIAEEMAGLATMTVQPAVRATASAGYTADSGMMSDGIAQAVYRAIIDAFRITQASSTGTSSGESKELVLKIDNTTLARMQLPAIIREGQRQGLNLVVQGV
jgi:tape measure domain-containing protein